MAKEKAPGCVTNQQIKREKKREKINKYVYCFGCGIKTLVSGNKKPGQLGTIRPEDK